MKNKRLVIATVLICLLPIILGIIVYDKLPEQMPIHFTIKDIPDNYAPKNFALFGLPIIMAIVQASYLWISIKVNKLKDIEKPKIIKIMEWFIPIMTVLIYIIMIEVSLGSMVYVGKSICLVLGVLFIIIGNSLPKMSYEVGKVIVHPMPKNEKTFQKLNKMMGCSFIIIGIVLLLLMIWV